MTKGTFVQSGSLDIIYLLKNTAVGFVLTIVLLFLVSVLGVFASLPEAVTKLLVSAVAYTSIGICGCRAARHVHSGGLISGAISGLIYIIVLYLIGSIVNGSFSLSSTSLITALISILSGAVGGIIGVNIRYKKRR